MAFNLEEDITSVLLSLADGKPGNVSDILFGYNRFPTNGSEADKRVMEIEDELMTRELVSVAEKGRTNNTTNGYYYFVLSKLGNRRVKEIQNRQGKKIIHAISTRQDDAQLRLRGLTNRGLLGYIDNKQTQENVALLGYLITFPNGPDYLYTLTPANERFKGRDEKELGIIGYARNKPAKGYVQLHRFFSYHHFHHLFVVNPNSSQIKKEDYRDESDDNPTYIRSQKSSGSEPLFLYSTSNSNYFTPVEQTNSAGIEELKIESIDVPFLQTLILKVGLSPTRFTITNDTSSPTSVTLNGTNCSFVIHNEKPMEFSVVWTPWPTGDPNLVKDIHGVENVSKHFRRWLIPIKQNPILVDEETNTYTSQDQNIAESTHRILTKGIFSKSDINIKSSHEIEEAFDVDILADEMIRVFKNFKSDTENMVGIFGPWGRGKTYLMHKIWSKLASEDRDEAKGNSKVEYIQVNYQAWRYQDTPASWAYLYEQFSLKYLGEKKGGILSLLSYHKKLIDLNVERDGIWNLALAGVLVGLACFLVIWQNAFLEGYGKVAASIAALIASPFLVIFVSLIVKNFKLDYWTRAINLIRKYGNKTSFRENLGIQAEIQKEFIHLINVWTKKNKTKRLVLFVDDLDRCKDEKTIEIIDSLRIILDDDKIKDKLIVIAAVDDRILQRAVCNKYRDQIDLNKEDLVKEYMDKLFIFSVKLGALTEAESREFFVKLVRGDLAKPTSVEVPKMTPVAESDALGNGPFEKNSSKEFKTGKMELIENMDDFTRTEADIFDQNIWRLNSPTPRKIKILYYRYRLAKNLLIVKHSTEIANGYWLEGDYLERFIQVLIEFSNKPVYDLEKEIISVHESKENNAYVVTGAALRSEYLELLKVLRVVIAY